VYGANIVHIAEIHSPPDNRLTKHVVVQGLVPALNCVEREWRELYRAAQAAQRDGTQVEKSLGSGALVIVGLRGQDKFFSNGIVSHRLFAGHLFTSVCSQASTTQPL
jgi:hypothetical protein